MLLSRTTRFLTLLFAAIQFAVPAVVSVADGTVAKGGRNSGSHVEDIGGKQCRPPHTEDCVICRFLTTTHSVGSATPAVSVVRIITAVSVSAVFHTEVDERQGFDSRAPPTPIG